MKKTMIFSIIIGFSISLIFPQSTHSQTLDLKQALKYFEMKDYSESAKYYEIAYKQNPDSKEIITKLALSYKFLGHSNLALPLFEKLMAGEVKDKELYFEYGELLRSLGEFSKARLCFLQYAEHNPIVGNYFAENCLYAIAQLKKPANCELKNLESNTEGAEFSPIVLGDDVLYSTNKTDETQIKSGLQVDVYKAVPLKPIVNSEASMINEVLHQESIGRGNFSFSPDRKKVAYSKAANMSITQMVQESAKLSIFLADVDEKGKWKNNTNFPHTNMNYSYGFPVFANEGKTLYFASNMPGGVGGFDLYVSSLDEEGKWSVPQNLGPVINTPGNEISPLHKNEKLFFSSDWHPGYGGFDIFYTNETRVGWTGVQNVGSCINSTKDEYHFTLDNDGVAYFTSNRMGGKGGEDIYSSSKLKLNNNKVENRILDKDIAVKSPFAAGTEKEITSAQLVPKEAIYEDAELKPNSKGNKEKIYFIQITALSRFTDQLASRFKKYARYGDIWKVESDGITKIRIGYYQSSNEASAVLALMRKNGIQEAFVVGDILDESRMKIILKASSDFDTPVSNVSEEGKFKIRVAEFKTPDWFDSSKITDLGNIEHWTKGGWTIIILGSYKSESTAKEILEKLKSRGFKDAYVCIENDGKLYRL